jgi:hypothetical protein
MRRTLMLVVAVVATACAAEPSPPANAETAALAVLEATRTGDDVGTMLACQKFTPLARNVDAGIVTNDESRSVVQGVYDLAKSRPDSAVATTSQRLLAILTTGAREADVKDAFSALVTACGAALK